MVRENLEYLFEGLTSAVTMVVDPWEDDLTDRRQRQLLEEWRRQTVMESGTGRWQPPRQNEFSREMVKRWIDDLTLFSVQMAGKDFIYATVGKDIPRLTEAAAEGRSLQSVPRPYSQILKRAYEVPVVKRVPLFMRYAPRVGSESENRWQRLCLPLRGPRGDDIEFLLVFTIVSLEVVKRAVGRGRGTDIGLFPYPGSNIVRMGVPGVPTYGYGIIDPRPADIAQPLQANVLAEWHRAAVGVGAANGGDVADQPVFQSLIGRLGEIASEDLSVAELTDSGMDYVFRRISRVSESMTGWDYLGRRVTDLPHPVGQMFKWIYDQVLRIGRPLYGTRRIVGGPSDGFVYSNLVLPFRSWDGPGIRWIIACPMYGRNIVELRPPEEEEVAAGDPSADKNDIWDA